MSDTNNKTVWLGNAVHARVLDGAWGGIIREPLTGEYSGTNFRWTETIINGSYKDVIIVWDGVIVYEGYSIPIETTTLMPDIISDYWSYQRGSLVDDFGSMKNYGIYRTRHA